MKYKKVRKNAAPELHSKITKCIAIHRATQTMKNGVCVRVIIVSLVFISFLLLYSLDFILI